MSLLVGLSGSAFAESANIPVTELKDISDKDTGPLGRYALTLEPKSWKHSETTHFVYHFTNENDAQTVYINAESYYAWVKEMFAITNDSWSKKSHIYIFSDKSTWEKFSSRASTAKQCGAFTTGWDLFIYRDPYWLSPKRKLAHEITHIITFRFLDGPIPLSMNEGIAEYVSYKALATEWDGNEYRVHTIIFMKENEYTSLKELIGAKDYPSFNQELFYRESELLVRYLSLNYPSNKFYELLRGLASGSNFEQLIKKIYDVEIGVFEEKFKRFATTGKNG